MTAHERSIQRQQRRAEWRRIIIEWERSGLDIRAFCRGRGVKEHLFYRWRRALELEARTGRKAAAASSFVLVSPRTEAGAGAGGRLELVSERGWRLRIPAGADEPTLRAVLAALQ